MKESKLLKSQAAGAEEKTTLATHGSWPLFLKRLFDILFSLFVLLLIWPLIVFVAIAIKLSSAGPVFYRGVRTGLYGKPFRILKFRTMVVDAEALGGPTTGTNDKRVTRVGALLRRTKLTEVYG